MGLSLEQPHEGPALVQLEPAFLDRISDAGAEFRARRLAAVLGEERRVDLLDVNAPVDRLDASGELDELACGNLRIWGGPRRASCTGASELVALDASQLLGLSLGLATCQQVRPKPSARQVVPIEIDARPAVREADLIASGAWNGLVLLNREDAVSIATGLVLLFEALAKLL